MHFGHKKLNFGSFLKSRGFRFNRYLSVILLSPFLAFANVGVMESKTCQGAFTNNNPKPSFIQTKQGKWQAVEVSTAERQEAQNKLWAMIENSSSTEKLVKKLHELVEKGADIYATDNGLTPLDYAVVRKDFELVKAIVRVARFTIKAEYSHWVKLLNPVGLATLLQGHAVSDYQRAINTIRHRIPNIVTNGEMEQDSIFELKSIVLYLSERQRERQNDIDLLRHTIISTGVATGLLTNFGFALADSSSLLTVMTVSFLLGMTAMGTIESHRIIKEQKKIQKTSQIVESNEEFFNRVINEEKKTEDKN